MRTQRELTANGIERLDKLIVKMREACDEWRKTLNTSKGDEGELELLCDRMNSGVRMIKTTITSFSEEVENLEKVVKFSILLFRDIPLNKGTVQE